MASATDAMVLGDTHLLASHQKGECFALIITRKLQFLIMVHCGHLQIGGEFLCMHEELSTYQTDTHSCTHAGVLINHTSVLLPYKRLE